MTTPPILSHVYNSEMPTTRELSVQFSVEAMVRGYHAYESVWVAVVGEELACKRERGNSEDPFAVAVTKGERIVGHVPRKISAVCAMFLRRGGSIICRVTGSRRYSEDLPQGGLEIPCVLTFRSEKERDSAKVKKLVMAALHPIPDENTPPRKKAKICDTNVVSQSDKIWVQMNRIRLTTADKQIISSGRKLNDLHINFAHHILKHKFPSLKGLQNTLYQSKKQPREEPTNKLQIIHSRGDHWIVASTINSVNNKVYVYDSVYSSLDQETEAVVLNLFQGSLLPVQMAETQKQDGGCDCGLFAIAVATALAFHQDAKTLTFEQTLMRPHLIQCFEKRELTPFSTK